ncbi:hypothetical protein COCCADRAFT_97270, partial [Bipolaris zeicola 26-R-13]
YHHPCRAMRCAALFHICYVVSWPRSPARHFSLHGHDLCELASYLRTLLKDIFQM